MTSHYTENYCTRNYHPLYYPYHQGSPLALGGGDAGSLWDSLQIPVLMTSQDDIIRLNVITVMVGDVNNW